MIHRVAGSERYRDSPTAVRCSWAFSDFVGACVMLDHEDEARRKAHPEPKGGPDGP
jgi:hypothetical protein